MSHTSCANCNAPRTPSNPLKSCGSCLSVSYCDRACQKAHWKTHKPTCRLRDDDHNSDADARGYSDGHGNIVCKDRVLPISECVVYAVPPSEQNPKPHSEIIIIGAKLGADRAKLTAEGRTEFDKMIVEGVRSGELKLNNTRASNTDDVAKALAAKYAAAKESNERIKESSLSQSDRPYAAYEKNGKLIAVFSDGTERVFADDAAAIMDVSPSAEFPSGYRDVIMFKPDEILEMRKMGAEENAAYKTYLFKKKSAQAEAGKTAEQVEAQRKERAAKAKDSARYIEEHKRLEENSHCPYVVGDTVFVTFLDGTQMELSEDWCFIRREAPGPDCWNGERVIKFSIDEVLAMQDMTADQKQAFKEKRVKEYMARVVVGKTTEQLVAQGEAQDAKIADFFSRYRGVKVHDWTGRSDGPA